MGKYLDIANALEAKRARGRATPALSEGGDFLTRHVSQPAREVFSDWQGLLIRSVVLGMDVWVVRTRQEGEELAKETGHPALLLDDVLAQKGRSRADARALLLPVLITGVVQ